MKVFLLRIACLSVGLMLIACFSERPEREVAQPTPSLTPSPVVTAASNASPAVSPALSPAPLTPLPTVSSTPLTSAAPPSLIIPVSGVRREQLHDTFNEARSEGRVHEAIDILAPQGTKVVAATDGTIARLFTSDKGGITIYQLSADQQLIFYYAHLDRYAEGLTEKQSVRQGELLGYVGDTGNAQPGNYHLHFAIWQITNPKNFWNGVNLNPYDILTHR